MCYLSKIIKSAGAFQHSEHQISNIVIYAAKKLSRPRLKDIIFKVFLTRLMLLTIVVMMVVIAAPIQADQNITWDRAVYWDVRYPSAWTSGQAVVGTLASAGYRILDADQLKIWMNSHISDGLPSVGVFCQDVTPDTVVESMSTTCTLRRYLNAGGKIIWFGGLPIYDQGHSDGTRTNWDVAGSKAILGFNADGAVWDSNQEVVFTTDGVAWGLTETWQSIRPTDNTNVRVLARDASGYAAAWVKHYMKDDTYRGFVRLFDRPGVLNTNDIRRVAEYPMVPVRNITSGKKHTYIQDAINEADPCDLIIVSRGVYNENIDFLDKRLTISSSDPNNSKIVASTIIKGTNKAVTFAKGENASVLTGFTITGAAKGIYCGENTSPTISKCIIVENGEYGIELSKNTSPIISSCEIICNNGTGICESAYMQNTPVISNTVIAANRLNGIKCYQPTIINCTIAANGKEGVAACQEAEISNSIIFFNNSANKQITNTTATVQYSDVQGGWAGTGNINQDPCFAETGFWDTNDTSHDTSDDTWSAGDYHLLSIAGRWVPSYPSPSDPNILISGWMTDKDSNPCIDAADPNAGYGDELWPHGKLLNMGAYGGTSQASLSQSTAGDIRDINNDNSVSMNDVSKLVDKWNSGNAPLKEDLNLDGTIDVNDLAFFDGNWQADSNNVVPQLDAIEDVNVTEGALVSFGVSATDTDGDELVYKGLGLPEGAEFMNHVFSWTPEQTGTYLVTFIVSDYKSLDYLTVRIIVE